MKKQKVGIFDEDDNFDLAKISRRAKKSKLTLAFKGKGKTAGRKENLLLVKKVVVLRYMKESPAHFTRKDKDIILSGVIEFNMNDTEELVRESIASFITTHKDLSSFGPYDFEFISVCGNHASISGCSSQSSFSGRAIKELCGCGKLYIRLLRDPNQTESVPLFPPSPTFSSSSQEEFPRFDTTKSGTCSSIECSSNSVSATPQDLSTLVSGASSSAVIDLTSSDNAPPPAFSITYEKFTPTEDIQMLCQKFSCLSLETIEKLYNLSEQSYKLTHDALNAGPTLSSLLHLAHGTFIKKELIDAPKIRYDKDDEPSDYLDSVLAFYKGKKFDRNAMIRVQVRGEPVVDEGGVRRQFLSASLGYLASCHSLGVFEGNIGSLRPAFRMSLLELLKIIGTFVGHSLVMDKIGFPFMAEFCYQYIAGQEVACEAAITINDASPRVQYVLSEVRLITLCLDFVMELLTKINFWEL